MKPQRALAAAIVVVFLLLSFGGTAEAASPTQDDWTADTWEALNFSVDKTDNLRLAASGATDETRGPADDWTAETWEALNFSFG